MDNQRDRLLKSRPGERRWRGLGEENWPRERAEGQGTWHMLCFRRAARLALGVSHKRGFAQKVATNWHQAEPVNARAVLLGAFPENPLERGPVLVIPVDGTPLIAARGDMIESSGKFDPKGSCHRCFSGRRRQGVNFKS